MSLAAFQAGLPDGDAGKELVFPPKVLHPLIAQQMRWDALYSGDVDRIDAIPEEVTAETLLQKVRNAVSLVFGRSGTGTNERHASREHVPLPADLATASADQLFSVAPRFVLADVEAAAADYQRQAGVDAEEFRDERQERVEEVVSVGHNHSAILEGAEIGAALGGAAFRVVWDEEIVDAARLQAMQPEQTIPIYRMGVLVAVIFWEVLESDRQREQVLHLEYHGRVRHNGKMHGYIEHALYKGDPGYLGTRVPVTDHPDTAHLSQLVNPASVILTGTGELSAGYIPNLKPNRSHRGDAVLREFGTSDFSGAEELFRDLDRAYASWQRDIALGQGRILVPESYLDTLSGSPSFNEDQRAFVKLQGGEDKDGGLAVELVQFKIRFEEHNRTCDDIQQRILRHAGLSDSSFGDGDEGIKTATGVKAEERLSTRTRRKKERYWASTLGSLSKALVEIDGHQYARPMYLDEAPEVRFAPDAIADIETAARSAQMMRVARAASTQTLVRMMHPDWDGQTVNDEVARIQEEEGEATNADMTGGGFGFPAPRAEEPTAAEIEDEQEEQTPREQLRGQEERDR